MADRQLASIQKITNLEAIPNADKIETASVLGWRVVSKKGDFQVGDLAVYFEVDSFLPIEENYEFLRKSCLRKNRDGVEGFRLKTIKLRGQISQGLLLPLSILKGRKLLTDTREGEQVYDWKEGRNVSSLLGVTKWEPMIPLCLSGKVKGSFPGFLPKTDETRVQVLQPVLDKHKGTLCYVTEKCDGSSATFYMKDGVFGVCSRNLELLETPENAFWQMARKLQIEEKLKTNKLDNIAIQGELCGPGIQSNPLQLKEFNIFFFNVYDIKEGKYKDVVELTNMCVLLRLNMVPIIERHYKLNNDVQALVTYATRKSVYNPNVWLEGIVIRPIEEIEDREFMNVLNYNRVSFKVINPEYLICNDG